MPMTNQIILNSRYFKICVQIHFENKFQRFFTHLQITKKTYFSSRISPIVEDVLSSGQTGFRPQKSCYYQVLASTDFGKCLKTDIVLFNLTAAYDIV